MSLRHILCGGERFTISEGQWIDFLSMVSGDYSPRAALAALGVNPNTIRFDVTGMTQREASRIYQQYVDSLR